MHLRLIGQPSFLHKCYNERGTTGVKLFPNPTSGHVTVEAPAASILAIFDSVGKRWASMPLSEGVNSLPLNDLAPGLYFYEVKDGERLLGSGKLVVGD